jgi:4-hydroxybenzoate polyprenyltransferase
LTLDENVCVIAEHTASPPRLLSYLRLFRAPNVFTAMADVVMGFCVAGAAAPPAALLLLLLASSLLYTAGMVLNDVYDYDIDLRERPQRPLPAGQIRVTTARRLGYGMLLAGLIAAWAAGYVPPQAGLPWRSGTAAMLLAVCVVAYDAWAKRTPLGPLFMGGCRFLNVLLGMSAARQLAPAGLAGAGYSAAELVAAGGIGVYIVGVTWFARTEADAKSSSPALLAATLIMFIGIALLGVFPNAASAPPLQLAKMPLRLALAPLTVWALLLALISFPVLVRCLAAAADPTSARVQTAVKRAILSLIVYDAAVTLAVAGPAWAMAVLVLLLPTTVLGAWVYST